MVIFAAARVLTGILGAAVVAGLTLSAMHRDAQQERRRRKCLELVEKGKVSPEFCVEFDKKGVIEDIRRVIDDAGKLALVGGTMYLVAKMLPEERRRG